MGKGSSYRNCYHNNINAARYHDNVHKKVNHENVYLYKKFKMQDYDGYDNYTLDEIQVALHLLVKLKEKLNNQIFIPQVIPQVKMKEHEGKIKKIESKERTLRQLYKVKLEPQFRDFVDSEAKKYLLTFEQFKNRIRKGIIRPGSGYGYYASPDTIYNIDVNPTDIIDGHYRTDFAYIYWYNYSSYISPFNYATPFNDYGNKF